MNPTADSKWDLSFTKSWKFSNSQLMLLSSETVKTVILSFLRNLRLIAIDGSSDIYARYTQVTPD